MYKKKRKEIQFVKLIIKKVLQTAALSQCVDCQPTVVKIALWRRFNKKKQGIANLKIKSKNNKHIKHYTVNIKTCLPPDFCVISLRYNILPLFLGPIVGHVEKFATKNLTMYDIFGSYNFLTSHIIIKNYSTALNILPR